MQLQKESGEQKGLFSNPEEIQVIKLSDDTLLTTTFEEALSEALHHSCCSGDWQHWEVM